MKRRLVIVLAAVAAVITVCLAFFFLYKPSYYRLYSGDRITGEITVNIDGRSAQFDEDRTREVWNCVGDFSVTDHTAKVSLKAGDYGLYEFAVYAVGLDQPLQFAAFQFNWWNVKTFRIDIAVDTVESTAYATCFATNINEEGNVYEEECTKDLNLTEDGWTIGID